MGPVFGALDQSVLYRIGVAIGDKCQKIIIVADVVFPKAALPDAAFCPRAMAGAQGAGGQPH